MAKEILKQAGKKAVESALHSMLPELIRSVAEIAARIEKVDTKLDRIDRAVDAFRLEIKQELHDQWDRSISRMNELGERLAHIEGKFQELTRSLDRQTDKMDGWIERLVQIEMTQTTRKRRAS